MTQLSPELSARIEQEAGDYADFQIGDRGKIIDAINALKWEDAKDDYIAGAKAYAHYKEQCEDLQRWKREAILVLDPLMDYGWSKESQMPLGKSITEVILQRAKQFQQAKKALEDLLSWHTESLSFDLGGKIERAKALLSTWKEEGNNENNKTDNNE